MSVSFAGDRSQVNLDLGVVGNCTVGASIDPLGRIVWCCQPRFISRDRVFRPAQLVRRIQPLAGHSRVRIRVRPHARRGASPVTVTRGSHHLRYLLSDCMLRLNTSAAITDVAEGAWFSLPGPVSLLLGPGETLPRPTRRSASSTARFACRRRGRT